MSKQEAANNWGRWGSDDERGTLNLLTAEVIKKAIGAVKKQKVYSLATPWEKTPTNPRRGRPLHLMYIDGGDYAAGVEPRGGRGKNCDDFISTAVHGTTHVDALCHVWYGDKIYNGFSENTITSAGARYCGIDKMKGFITRGILLDVAGHKNVDYLDGGYAIKVADLESCAQAEGVSLQTGDAVLIRTGWSSVLVKNPEKVMGARPGIGIAVARWLKSKDVCCVGSDTTGVEVRPEEDNKQWLPVHQELIRDQGVYIIEMCALDELAKDRVYEFLFVVAPLPIPGGSGSPVNPLAIA